MRHAACCICLDQKGKYFNLRKMLSGELGAGEVCVYIEYVCLCARCVGQLKNVR